VLAGHSHGVISESKTHRCHTREHAPTCAKRQQQKQRHRQGCRTTPSHNPQHARHTDEFGDGREDEERRRRMGKDGNEEEEEEDEDGKG
jgi:hypothetical protein